MLKQILFHVHDTLVCEIGNDSILAWTTTVYMYVCVCERQKERKSKKKEMQRKTHKDDRLNIISWGQIRLINLELAADLIKQEEH